MAARAKFLFDEDFGVPKRPDGLAEPTVALAQLREEAQRAEEAGFLRGVAEGRRQAEADEAARLASSLQRLALAFAQSAEHLTGTAARSEAEAAKLAVAVARKLAGALVAARPLVEIEALARSVIAELRSAPHAVVRVHDSLVDAVKARLDSIAAECGFSGALVVLGEPDIAIGDARLDWADGGAGRDRNELERSIDEAVERFLARLGVEEKQP
jgi:flagellar assembly protein FliH